MNFNQILKDLKAKKYAPIYFLMGEESYYIDQITDYISDNILSEAEQSFNQTVLYGKDTDMSNLITLARRFPMMTEHQIVILKEAQEIKKIEDLMSYVENYQKSTILVINYKYKTLDKRKKLYKLLDKIGVLFESKKLYENQIPKWIETYLKDKKAKISNKSGMLLTDFLGNDLSKISNELDKLILTLPNGETEITAKHIEKNIGISKDFNNFELQNALITKDILKANRIINYFSNNPKNNPIVLTISSLYYFFSRLLAYHAVKTKDKKTIASTLKINMFFIQDYQIATKNYNVKKVVEIISILREYDLKSKGVGNVSATQGELLKEMIMLILI